MTFPDGWPYAAKAIVQHEWQIDHLNIWLTFRLHMLQTVQPANTDWLLYVDTVLTPVASSTWQDAFTMLLTSVTLLSTPLRVLLAFDGPSLLLRTTYGKHWEPWGPILSQDLLA
jgi:hypothetical protein